MVFVGLVGLGSETHRGQEELTKPKTDCLEQKGQHKHQREKLVEPLVRWWEEEDNEHKHQSHGAEPEQALVVDGEPICHVDQLIELPSMRRDAIVSCSSLSWCWLLSTLITSFSRLGKIQTPASLCILRCRRRRCSRKPSELTSSRWSVGSRSSIESPPSSLSLFKLLV